jgi:hypothetical protein
MPQTGRKTSSHPFLEAVVGLPGCRTLFMILSVDLTIMGFAVCAVVNGMGQRQTPAPRPVPTVLCDYRRPLAPAPVPRRLSLLVDDFSRTSGNCLGGAREGFGFYGGRIEDSIAVDPAGASCLRLAYDVASPSSVCGYSSDLSGTDLSRYRRLSLQVRGESSDEVLKIELRSGDISKTVAVSQLLPEGLPVDWKTVSVSLKDFAPAAGQPHKVTFLFEHAQGMPYTGTVYVRNIRLR